MQSIKIAETDDEIGRCYAVMSQLRPHVTKADFIPRIRGQMQAGYRLVYLSDSHALLAVAGYRIGSNLAWGEHLYVDDLVTAAAHRSQGAGAALLAWLVAEARRHGCSQLHLDSGVQRTSAHRFYEREGMRLASYHYVMTDIAPL